MNKRKRRTFKRKKQLFIRKENFQNPSGKSEKKKNINSLKQHQIPNQILVQDKHLTNRINEKMSEPNGDRRDQARSGRSQARFNVRRKPDEDRVVKGRSFSELSEIASRHAAVVGQVAEHRRPSKEARRRFKFNTELCRSQCYHVGHKGSEPMCELLQTFEGSNKYRCFWECRHQRYCRNRKLMEQNSYPKGHYQRLRSELESSRARALEMRRSAQIPVKACALKPQAASGDPVTKPKSKSPPKPLEAPGTATSAGWSTTAKMVTKAKEARTASATKEAPAAVLARSPQPKRPSPIRFP